MAEAELDSALATVPVNTLHQTALFVEIMKVLDSWTFSLLLKDEEQRVKKQDYEMLRWGWNLAAKYLFKNVNVSGSIPLIKPPTDIQQFASTLLYKFGKSVLLRRAAEMIRRGFLQVQIESTGLRVSTKAPQGQSQFLDNLEFLRFEVLKAELADPLKQNSKGWTLFDYEMFSAVRSQPGSFMSKPLVPDIEQFKVEHIDSLISSLLRPVDLGRGMIVDYQSVPEVDDHFLAEALPIVLQWRDEAGLDPDSELRNIPGSVLTVVIIFLLSLQLKHIRFVLLATKKIPELSIYESLMHSISLNDLANAIADWSAFDLALIREALNLISMYPDDMGILNIQTAPLLPLLVNFGNDVALLPISCLLKNPIATTLSLIELREPALKPQISQRREDWMRSDLYALFEGNRYLTVSGNVKLRRNNRIVTDIDAAVFDRLTGELALFQLKWQDYFTNSIQQLSSKAVNLTREFDEWAEVVNKWIQEKGTKELGKTLRLNLRNSSPIRTTFLFGISRTFARMSGFGCATGSEQLAIANWPHFLRKRHEVGPAARVLGKLHEALRSDMRQSLRPKPQPYEIQVGSTSIYFEDLWNTYELPQDD